MNGTNSDSLIALDKRTGKLVHAARAVSDGLPPARDGRAHRRSERGLEGTRALVGERHARGLALPRPGMGTRGQIAHFQLRPNPLAK